MSRVKCEWCGNYVDETEQNCPHCDGVNSAYMRTASDTPKTIETLQQWYKDRNLPPEDVTRFFIGKDIKEPRAFGIYRDGENVVVYKNKDDGSRAIRYQGTDEAYAVNEIYMKLKEEILRQKSRNVARAVSDSMHGTRTSHSTPARQSDSSGDEEYHSRHSDHKSIQADSERHPLQEKLKNFSWKKFWYRDIVNNLWYRKIQPNLIAIIPILAVLAIALTVYFAVSRAGSNPRSNYYYIEGQDIYYNYGYSFTDRESGYEWWKYNEKEQDWEVYRYMNGKKEFPDPLNRKSERSLILPFTGHREYTYDKYDIRNSRNYIDIHHTAPSHGYYEYDGNTYYYLNDYNGGTFGTADHTGWYIYDDDDDEWNYYAGKDDKDTLGELWYFANQYQTGYTENNAPVSAFEDTGFYQEYQDANDAANQYYEPHDNDDVHWWNNDNDYNWNSGSSWDSDDSNWNSDWDSGYSSYDSDSSYDWNDSGSSWDYGDSGWDSGSDWDYDSGSDWDYSSSDWSSDW